MPIFQTTKRPLTAGTLFKNSMIALINNLASKQPHYVRCIKPNEEKSPVLFDKERVRHQVRGGAGAEGRSRGRGEEPG